MPIRQRYKALIEAEGKKVSTFSRELGCDSKNLNNFLTGNTKSLNTDILIKTLQKRPWWNLRWILLGEGERYVKPIDQEGVNPKDAQNHIAMISVQIGQLQASLTQFMQQANGQ